MLYHTHCSSLFRFLEFFFHTVDITYTKQKVDITQTGKIDGDKKEIKPYLLTLSFVRYQNRSKNQVPYGIGYIYNTR